MLTTLGPGSTLGGRYSLTQRIAVGGMGEVWRADDTVLGRAVAVKVLKPELASDPTFLTRFRNEARHTAGLSHPGIASVFDYGEVDDTAYLVMELVDGEPLSAVLAREGRLEPERVLDVIGQAGLALQAAHEAGVIHRDVKPGNLLIRKDGVVKVTDFGVARVADTAAVTQTGLVLGTAHYLSPEQASGQPVTPASDVYSLGVVAFECLSGDRPFSGDSPVAIAMAHIQAPTPPLPADVPPPVAALVERAMQKDPAARQPSAGDLGRTALATRAALAGGAPLPAMDVQPATAARTDPPTRAMPMPPVPPADLIRPGRTGRQPTQRWVRNTLIAFGLLVVLVGAMLLRACSGPSYADVPQVTGTQYPAAASALRKLGFTVTEHTVHDASHAAGYVLAQDRKPGARLAQGTRVTLTVASGPLLRTVDPAAYVGHPYPEAAAALQALGLRVARALMVSDVQADTVLAVAPTGQVREGTTVTLAVAVPPEDKHGRGKGQGGGD